MELYFLQGVGTLKRVGLFVFVFDVNWEDSLFCRPLRMLVLMFVLCGIFSQPSIVQYDRSEKKHVEDMRYYALAQGATYCLSAMEGCMSSAMIGCISSTESAGMKVYIMIKRGLYRRGDYAGYAAGYADCLPQYSGW